MIDLRPMRRDEFAAYRDCFVPDYADEIEANYGLTPDAALAQSEREFGRDLHDGVETPDQVLLCIVAADGDDRPLGYLWYQTDKEAGLAFVYDFFILPDNQDKGYGTKALALLEAMLVADGYRHIRLRVAANNARARHVYERAGFGITGYNLVKQIG